MMHCRISAALVEGLRGSASAPQFGGSPSGSLPNTPVAGVATAGRSSIFFFERKEMMPVQQLVINDHGSPTSMQFGLCYLRYYKCYDCANLHHSHCLSVACILSCSCCPLIPPRAHGSCGNFLFPTPSR